jgi:hypothetical protein
MKNAIGKRAVIFAMVMLAITGFRKSSDNDAVSKIPAAGQGVHFKIAGKQYDVTVIRGLYDPKSKTFAIFNAGLPGFPQTTISLAIGTNFTGSTGTFKSDKGKKGFVFGFVLYAGSFTKPIVGYGAGQDDSSSGETVAGSPISITLTSFSSSGSPGAATGNITAQGTFSGTAYDILNKKYVSLTDGTFNIHP